MKKIIVNVELGKGNFGAYIESAPGIVATGNTPETIEKNITEAIESHVETLKELGMKVPSIFLGKYELVFKYEPMALLSQYSGVLTPSAMERITGINRKQMSHYATGLKKPREDQKKKITTGLHKLGQELLRLEL